MLFELRSAGQVNPFLTITGSAWCVLVTARWNFGVQLAHLSLTRQRGACDDAARAPN